MAQETLRARETTHPSVEDVVIDLKRKEGSTVRKPEVILGLIIIINACLWGFTILMVSHTLKGTGAYQEIQHLLGAGAGMSTVIVGGGMASVVSLLKARERKGEHEPDDR